MERLVLQPFSWRDIVGALQVRVRLGMANRMAMRGVTSHDSTAVHRAEVLGKIKFGLFKAVALPLALLMRLFPVQGVGMYCEARLEAGKRIKVKG